MTSRVMAILMAKYQNVPQPEPEAEQAKESAVAAVVVVDDKAEKRQDLQIQQWRLQAKQTALQSTKDQMTAVEARMAELTASLKSRGVVQAATLTKEEARKHIRNLLKRNGGIQ